jgi:putative cell wall-binding protein
MRRLKVVLAVGVAAMLALVFALPALAALTGQAVYVYPNDPDERHSVSGVWNNDPLHARVIDASSETTVSWTPHSFESTDAALPVTLLGGIPVDEDWQFFEGGGYNVYEIVAEPTSQVAGADPVLEVYDAQAHAITHTYFRRANDLTMGAPGDKTAKAFFRATTLGDYYFRVVDANNSGMQLTVLPGGLMVWSAKGVTYRTTVIDHGDGYDRNLSRPDAPDRYTLAANLARLAVDNNLSTTKHVIIACGADAAAADSLVAAGLAGVYQAPILLIDKTKAYLPPATKSVIQAMDTANGATKLAFHIVGGPASVPDALKKQLTLAAPGASVDRLGGADRYQVATNVAARMRSVLGPTYPHDAFIVNGHDAAFFWDAMIASPVAFRMHKPILLTTRASVPATTKAAKTYYSSYTAIGQRASLDPVVSSYFGAGRIDDAYTAGYDRQRLARYAAQVMTNWGWTGNAQGPGEAVITNKLADSLVGGTFAGFRGGVVVFTYDSANLDKDPATPWTGEYLNTNIFKTSRGWILGGTASITTPVNQRLWDLLCCDPRG